MRGRQDFANDESLDNGRSGTPRSPPHEPKQILIVIAPISPLLPWPPDSESRTRSRGPERTSAARGHRILDGAFFESSERAGTSRRGLRPGAARGHQATNGGGNAASIDLDLLSSFPTARIPLVEPSVRPGLSFERLRHPIAFPEF